MLDKSRGQQQQQKNACVWTLQLVVSGEWVGMV